MHLSQQMPICTDMLTSPVEKPYRHFFEHYQDEFYCAWLNLRLAIDRHGIAPPPLQSGTENQHKQMEITESDPSYLIRNLSDMESAISSRVELSLEQGIDLPLVRLARALDLSETEQKIVALCLALELDTYCQATASWLQGHNSLVTVTPNFLLDLLFPNPEDRWNARHWFQPQGILHKHLLQSDDKSKRPSNNALDHIIRLDGHIVGFLLGQSNDDPTLSHVTSWFHSDDELPSLITDFPIQEKMRQFAERSYFGDDQDDERNVLFHLWGPSGSGKKFHSMHFAKHFNQSLLMIDASAFLNHKRDISQLLNCVVRESRLTESLPCLYHFERILNNSDLEDPFDSIVDLLNQMNTLCFVLSEKQWKPKKNLKHRLIDIELSVPDESCREQLWRSMSNRKLEICNMDWGAIASSFSFTPGQIARAVERANTLGSWNNQTTLQQSLLYRACYDQCEHELATKSVRLKPIHSWHDLVLPPAQLERLHHASNQVKNRARVYRDWGFHKRLSYGRGISMLFAGPPGTGKTMAAEVIAKELNLEIYKIDMSQIISKYIGETEQNLSFIFAQAQRSNSILFFDEMDALFGKRSEVKDSHDKYANIEVAHLLQKIEEYEGVSIMATNLPNNIDEAFIRRISYVIRFPFPDRKYRELLWESMFPEDAPVHDLDFDYLGEKFELAGGNIKNIVVSAAFMAAEGDKPISMSHIMQATYYEYEKLGRSLDLNKLGIYSDLVLPSNDESQPGTR